MNKKNPFTYHIKSAIKVNRSRKKYYSNQTNGESKIISFLLIFFSYLMLPVIFFIDKSAKKFSKIGIKILENDFIELSEINSKKKLVEKRDVIDNEAYMRIDFMRKTYIKTTKKLLKKQNLIEICRNTYNFIEIIEKIEKNDNCNIPMTKHIAESIGFNALHGIEYSKQSNGKTLYLTNFIVKLHILGLYNSLRWFDKKSQKFYQAGVGVVINDIPSIPFSIEWRKFNDL